MASRLKKRLILGTLATLVVLLAGVVLVVRSRTFQIAYHKWQMQRAYDATWGKAPDVQQDGLVGYTVGDSYERYEHHRQQLVELGHIVRKRYTFEHILATTEESEHLSRKLLTGECPPHIDFVSPYPEEPAPMKLTVWCYPENAKDWDDFVARHDRPDYREVFMHPDP